MFIILLHIILFLYEFNFSTRKLFVKNKGKIKVFPSNQNNKRKIIKKQEWITIVYVGDRDSLRAEAGPQDEVVFAHADLVVPRSLI